MVADRTEGFCPGAVTREPGDKQQSPATGRLLEGWRVRGASEEVAFESQPGLGQLLGVRRLACRWEQAGVVATAPRDGPSKCFRRGAWRALAAASWPWRVRCRPVRPGSALLWWHRNRCPPRWRCQHGGVCRQPGVGRGFTCFPGEEVSSPSVGVFKEGAHIPARVEGEARPRRFRPGHQPLFSPVQRRIRPSPSRSLAACQCPWRATPWWRPRR